MFRDDSTSSSDSINTQVYWLKCHPVSIVYEKWQDEEFNEFIRMIRYPHFAKSEDARRIIEARILEKHRYQCCVFKAWQAGLQPEQLEEQDRYEFELYFMHIFCSWSSFRSQVRSQDIPRVSRKGIENLIELAFHLRTGAEHMWLQSVELALPDEPDAVRAECVTTTNLPSYDQSLVECHCRSFNFSWSYALKPQSIITFVYVASEDDSKRAEREALRRLKMCFYSCHMHRQSLCCKDGQVFGMLSHGQALQLFVSFWNGDDLEMRPVFEHFTPQIIDDFLNCYFTLCRISEHQAEYFREEFKRWDDQGIRRRFDIEESSKNLWRKENRGEAESSDGSCDEDAWEDSAMSGVPPPRAKPVVDPKVEFTLERVRRGRPPRGGYLLTRRHKKAFDIVTDADMSEEHHSIHSPSTWAEETSRYSDEYEDPAPYAEDDSGENGNASKNGASAAANAKSTTCASDESVITPDKQELASAIKVTTAEEASSILISVTKGNSPGNKCSWNVPLISMIPCRRTRSET